MRAVASNLSGHPKGIGVSTSFDQRLPEVFAELIRGVVDGEHIAEALDLQ